MSLVPTNNSFQTLYIDWTKYTRDNLYILNLESTRWLIDIQVNERKHVYAGLHVHIRHEPMISLIHHHAIKRVMNGHIQAIKNFLHLPRDISSFTIIWAFLDVFHNTDINVKLDCCDKSALIWSWSMESKKMWESLEFSKIRCLNKFFNSSDDR